MVIVVAQVVFFLLGAALIGAGCLALAGRLPGNPWFGVRTPETRQVEQAWVLANRTAGPGFVVAGVGLVAGGLGLLTLPGWLAIAFAIFTVLFAMVMVSYAGLMGAKAAAIWRAQAEQDGTLPEVLMPFGSASGESCCGGSGAVADAAVVSEFDGTTGASHASVVSGARGSADAEGSAGAGGVAQAQNDPAADCGVSGGCSSCSLSGMCTTSHAGASGSHESVR